MVHHDTNRNLTYRHGLDQTQISGVGVQGELRGTATSFKQPEAQARVQEQVALSTQIYLYIYCTAYYLYIYCIHIVYLLHIYR